MVSKSVVGCLRQNRTGQEGLEASNRPRWVVRSFIVAHKDGIELSNNVKTSAYSFFPSGAQPKDHSPFPRSHFRETFYLLLPSWAFSIPEEIKARHFQRS